MHSRLQGAETSAIAAAAVATAAVAKPAAAEPSAAVAAAALAAAALATAALATAATGAATNLADLARRAHMPGLPGPSPAQGLLRRDQRMPAG